LQSPRQARRLPRPGPGIGHDLTVRQELACALRILAREGLNTVDELIAVRT